MCVIWSVAKHPLLKAYYNGHWWGLYVQANGKKETTHILGVLHNAVVIAQFGTFFEIQFQRALWDQR
jgi:hypothetical protein